MSHSRASHSRLTAGRWLSPGFIVDQIQRVDEQSRQERQACHESELQGQLRIWKLLAVACLCLLLVHYGKYSANLADLLKWIDGVVEGGRLYRDFRHYEYRELVGYVWWGAVNLLGFLIIPMLAVRFWLKEPLAYYGWQAGDVRQHWKGYVLLASPIMLFAVIASFGDDFSRHYPFYSKAQRSWFDLLAFEIIYILQFVAVEFFFRGYLVNGLKRQFGSLSVAVMCLPYLMLHFPKLWPESLGAILFGFFLGVLALMSRSIWGGVAVHVSIALTMDIAAMLQTGGLPERW